MNTFINLNKLFTKYDFLNNNTIDKDDVFFIISFDLNKILSSQSKKFINDYLNSTSREYIDFKSFQKLIRKLYVIDAFESSKNINIKNLLRKNDRSYSYHDVYIENPDKYLENRNNGYAILKKVSERFKIDEKLEKCKIPFSTCNTPIDQYNTPLFFEKLQELSNLNISESVKVKNKRIYQSYKYKKLFQLINDSVKDYSTNILNLKRDKQITVSPINKITYKNEKKNNNKIQYNNFSKKIDEYNDTSLKNFWKKLIEDINVEYKYSILDPKNKIV